MLKLLAFGKFLPGEACFWRGIGDRVYIVSDLVKEKVNSEMLMLTTPPSVC